MRFSAAAASFLLLLVAQPAGGEEPVYVARDEQGTFLFTNVPRDPLVQRLPSLPAGESARRRFQPFIEAAAARQGLDSR
ncbi:MAG: hypothetical protein ACREJF_03055, partial [Candidatus Methylomirabilales bacterium]